jgi:hypothetical protein
MSLKQELVDDLKTVRFTPKEADSVDATSTYRPVLLAYEQALHNQIEMESLSEILDDLNQFS